jgi:hypothetical protein
MQHYINDVHKTSHYFIVQFNFTEAEEVDSARAVEQHRRRGRVGGASALVTFKFVFFVLLLR